MQHTLKKGKKAVIIAAAVIILLAVLAVLTYYTAVSEIAIVAAGMASTMNTLETRYLRIVGLQDLSQELDRIAQSSSYLINAIIQEADSIPEALQLLPTQSADYYLTDNTGKVWTSSGAPALRLTAEQRTELRAKGELNVAEEDGIVNYTLDRLPRGELITCARNFLSVGTQSVFKGLDQRYDYLEGLSGDGIVVNASDPALIGARIPEQLEAPLFHLDQDVKCKFADYRYGFADLNGMNAYCLITENGGYAFALYYPTRDYIGNVVNEMVAPAIILCGTFAVLLALWFLLQKNGEDHSQKWVRVGKTKRCFDASQVRHLSCFVLFACVLTLLFNIHFFEFSAYSLQSALSTDNLNMLSDNLKAVERDRNTMTQLAKDHLNPMADAANSLLALNEDYCTHERLQTMAKNCFLSEISVYDEAGVLVASSGDYVGYALPTDASDPLYAARQLLTSTADSVFCIDGKGENGFWLAHKRKNVPGILCLKMDDPALKRVEKYYSREEAICGTDFGNATTFFVRTDDADITYVIEPFSTQIEAKEISIPQVLLQQDNYFGLAVIDGMESYVHSKRNGGITVISALECRLLHDGIGRDALLLAAGFALLLAVLILGSFCRWENVAQPFMQAEEDPPERGKTSLFADRCFRTMAKWEFAVLIVAYCLMMFKRTVGMQTVLEFIFSGAWERGIHLFSLNACIIVAVLVALALFLIKKFLAFLGKSVGAKGLTVSSILSSILKWVALIGVVVYCLYQFGVNTAALIAGMGVAGIIAGIAAKDIFGDLMAGLFLIFEGNIRVGDFIRYKDFYGEVVEIGARVTVIQRYNKKLMINNSDLRQYFRLSDDLAAAWVEINVGLGENVDRIKELVESSSDWYQSQIPNLQKGPQFSHVSQFDANGIRVCVMGFCTANHVNSTKRRLMLSTLELFRQNGITLGKNVLQIEMEEKE